MDTILDELFSSNTRSKILKLFFRNSEKNFSIKEVADRIRADYYAVRREIFKLEGIKILEVKADRTQKLYFLNSSFAFLGELRSLVLHSSPISQDKLHEKLKNLGKFKLIILSGIFIGSDKSRLDLFLVGNNVKEKTLGKFLLEIEAEVGKEIDYVLFSEEEFRYRKNMFDKLVLEALEGPKKVLVDK